MQIFNEEKFKELNQKIGYKKEQSVIGISNKHFDVLVNLIKEKKLKTQHVPFAFSYLYLQTYLFRYTKYDKYVPSVGEVKEILTYDSTTKTINYIIKDGGVLDAAKLTKTLYDFPIVHSYGDEGLTFDMVTDLYDEEYEQEWRNERNVKFNSNCKYPVLGFYDEIENFNEVTLNNNDGTFFFTSNLTLIDWKIFNYCMSNEELGCTGFYLYCFIKWQEGLYSNCMMGLDKMAKLSGVPSRTLSRYLKTLRQYKLIKCVTATFVKGAKESKEHIDKESNTYFANEYTDICNEKIKLERPTYISVEEYLEKKRREGNKDEDKNKSIHDELYG